MRRYLILFLLLAAGAPLSDAGAAERTKPVRIGALTDSWGPTPGMVGLRDGLQELGYQENKDFVIGVRFTQGDISALPTAARQLVQQGVDILFHQQSLAGQGRPDGYKPYPDRFLRCGRSRRSSVDRLVVSEQFKI